MKLPQIGCGWGSLRRSNAPSPIVVWGCDTPPHSSSLDAFDRCSWTFVGKERRTVGHPQLSKLVCAFADRAHRQPTKLITGFTFGSISLNESRIIFTHTRAASVQILRRIAPYHASRNWPSKQAGTLKACNGFYYRAKLRVARYCQGKLSVRLSGCNVEVS